MIDGYNKPTYIYGGYLTVPSILKNKREMPDCTRINILIARRKKKKTCTMLAFYRRIQNEAHRAFKLLISYNHCTGLDHKRFE